jgi:hypothetical protein
VLPFLNSNAQVRRLRISVPLTECLVDNEKYFRPDELAPAAGVDRSATRFRANGRNLYRRKTEY